MYPATVGVRAGRRDHRIGHPLAVDVAGHRVAAVDLQATLARRATFAARREAGSARPVLAAAAGIGSVHANGPRRTAYGHVSAEDSPTRGAHTTRVSA